MKSQTTLKPIEIRPEVNILSVLRHLNYKPWYAIAEFIDNSLQSYISNRDRLIKLHGSSYRLIVRVQVDTAPPGRIVIADNAAGISAEDFPRAFRAAQIPQDRSGLSEFGMGMKSAACWFAQDWSVRTKALDEFVERTISFDIDHIIDYKIESLDAFEREERSPLTYTVVTLRGLHHIPQGRTIGKIKAHLASIYRKFIRDERLIIEFDDEVLEYSPPAILTTSPYTPQGMPLQGSDTTTWRKDINLDFGEGQRITGFAALREVGSTPLAGFALFRRDRLIEGSHDETYRPSYIFKQTNSYPYQRLFGELNIEGFEVSHTKDGFRWEEYEDLFLEFLKKELEKQPLNLISQAENYRALPSRKSIHTRAATATDAVAQHIEDEIEPILIDAHAHHIPPNELPLTLPDYEPMISEKVIAVDDGNYKWIVTLRTSLDPAREDWISVSKNDTQQECNKNHRLLGIDLSLAHPFSLEFLGANNENIELFLRFATATVISLILSEDMTAVPPDTVLYNLNSLLRNSFSQTSREDK